MDDRSTLKRVLPALAGAVVIGVIALVVLITRSGDSKKPAPAPAPSSAVSSAGPQERPTLPEAATTHAHEDDHEEELVDEPLTVPEDERRQTGLVFGPDVDPQLRAEVEEQRKEWAPLTYDEMVAKSKPFLETFALRERTLEEQISKAEAAGDEAKAKQRQIELERLRLRKAELERALSENKLP